MNIPWWGYVILAGLSWGTYVPIIFYGGSELGGKANARLMAILCVGAAYFVIGVLFPLVMFLSKQEEWPTLKTTGLVFACLAGVAGAVGAICVVFASGTAVRTARSEPRFIELQERQAKLETQIKENPASKDQVEPELQVTKTEMAEYQGKYRLFIAPLIFGLAPVINTLISSVWHPKPGNPFNFAYHPPGGMLLVGIVLVGAGVFLVLYSKEASETKPKPQPTAVETPAEKT